MNYIFSAKIISGPRGKLIQFKKKSAINIILINIFIVFSQVSGGQNIHNTGLL